VKKPPREAVIAAATQATHDVVDYWFRSDSCILQTKVLIGVLADFGIRAKPMSAQVHIYNPTMGRFVLAGIDDPETIKTCLDTGGGWGVGLGMGGFGGKGVVADGPVELTEEELTTAGYLVAVVEGPPVICDPSLPQASRPEHDMPLRPQAFGVSKEQLKGMYTRGPDVMVRFTLETGVVLDYRFFPEQSSFRASRDWHDAIRQRDRVRPLVQDAGKKTRALLQSVASRTEEEESHAE